jgi:uncharacterized protein YoxC
MQFDPMTILLLILAAAGIWAVVELALTIRKARSTVEEVSRSAIETIEQVQPIISKLDGAMDDLQPSLRQVDPLMEKVTVSLDEVNVSLRQVNGILEDVSSVSETAVGVTGAVSQVANNAANAANGIVNKITGRKAPAIEGGAPAQIEAAEPDDEPERNPGYVTYAEKSTDSAQEAPAADGDSAAADAAENEGE